MEKGNKSRASRSKGRPFPNSPATQRTGENLFSQPAILLLSSHEAHRLRRPRSLLCYQPDICPHHACGCWRCWKWFDFVEFQWFWLGLRLLLGFGLCWFGLGLRQQHRTQRRGWLLVGRFEHRHLDGHDRDTRGDLGCCATSVSLWTKLEILETHVARDLSCLPPCSLVEICAFGRCCTMNSIPTKQT